MALEVYILGVCEIFSEVHITSAHDNIFVPILSLHRIV